MIIGSLGLLSDLDINFVGVGDSNQCIEPDKNARNLGSWFDEHIAMDIHIWEQSVYNRQIREILSAEAHKMLIHIFVTLHLNYLDAAEITRTRELSAFTTSLL